jgi:preprotein translocase subunit SecF
MTIATIVRYYYFAAVAEKAFSFDLLIGFHPPFVSSCPLVRGVGCHFTRRARKMKKKEEAIKQDEFPIPNEASVDNPGYI